jgi:hypothetical protein
MLKVKSRLEAINRQVNHILVYTLPALIVTDTMSNFGNITLGCFEAL